MTPTRRVIRRAAPCLLHPGTVMLAAQFFVYAAAEHRVHGALHAQCPDIDVSDDQRGKNDRRDGVRKLRGLEPRQIRERERKHEVDACEGHRHPSQSDTPENDLLAEIELARWRMHSTPQQSPALRNPT